MFGDIMTGLGVGLASGGATVAVGLSLQSQINLLQSQIVALNAQLAQANLNFIFLETEVDAHSITLEGLVTDVQIAEANITTLEINTAGITRAIYAPVNYPGQNITKIYDTVYINGDVIINGNIKNTIWNSDIDYDLQLYPLSSLRTI